MCVWCTCICILTHAYKHTQDVTETVGQIFWECILLSVAQSNNSILKYFDESIIHKVVDTLHVPLEVYPRTKIQRI